MMKSLKIIVILYYGITISKQKVIRNNKRAETYFTDKIAVFISFIVMSGGSYRELLMVFITYF